MTRLALIAPLAMVELACASAHLKVIEPLSSPVSRVSLSIAPARTTSMTEEQQSRLRSTLTTSLVDSGISVVASAGAPGLAGEVTRFQPGSRALRYFIDLKPSRVYVVLERAEPGEGRGSPTERRAD
jgi:hypothetical protein